MGRLRFAHPCIFCPRGNTKDSIIKGSDGEYLGKPFSPEALSLSVDWLPALFANTEEYPSPGAKLVSLHTQGWSARVQQGRGT